MVVPEVDVMAEQNADHVNENVDVAVIGGGAAGLSAAMVLGRARRSVVVIDAGSPRNAPADAMHGFLSRDGMNPAELLETGRKEVDRYGGVVVRAEADAAYRTADKFRVVLENGSAVTARRLLVTTGLVDELPDIPGLRERWGRDVLHCPYCHGWEVRDEPIGVLGTGPRAVHQALLFRQWTPDVVLFTHTAPALTDEQAEQLAARDIHVVTGTVESLQITDDRLTGVRMSDGTVVARRAVTVAPRMVAAARILATLGLEPTEHPLGAGEFIAADPTGRTAVPGVWVAGNVTDLMAQVVAAAAGGVVAAAAINADLVEEDTRHAVERRRAVPSADYGDMFTQESWDERYRSVDAVWSGKPNPRLVATATELMPGSALDVGSGEGADAIWLASQGWEVTGVDISTVALERAAARAGEAGADVAARISWEHADVFTFEPGVRRYDLVSAQFMHLPQPALADLHRRLAAAVRPGGTLLIVGHHVSDLETFPHRRHLAGLMFTAEQVAAALDPKDWDVEASTLTRVHVDHEGGPVTLHDAVVRAVRR
jgi:thioredoxin reductase/2-polyprenyl-3-methyl-5-hydroxy-6-metoxy-1,4-benzoquinol methylase